MKVNSLFNVSAGSAHMNQRVDLELDVRDVMSDGDVLEARAAEAPVRARNRSASRKPPPIQAHTFQDQFTAMHGHMQDQLIDAKDTLAQKMKNSQSWKFEPKASLEKIGSKIRSRNSLSGEKSRSLLESEVHALPQDAGRSGSAIDRARSASFKRREREKVVQHATVDDSRNSSSDYAVPDEPQPTPIPQASAFDRARSASFKRRQKQQLAAESPERGTVRVKGLGPSGSERYTAM